MRPALTAEEKLRRVGRAREALLKGRGSPPPRRLPAFLGGTPASHWSPDTTSPPPHVHAQQGDVATAAPDIGHSSPALYRGDASLWHPFVDRLQRHAVDVHGAGTAQRVAQQRASDAVLGDDVFRDGASTWIVDGTATLTPAGGIECPAVASSSSAAAGAAADNLTALCEGDLAAMVCAAHLNHITLTKIRLSSAARDVGPGPCTFVLHAAGPLAFLALPFCSLNDDGFELLAAAIAMRHGARDGGTLTALDLSHNGLTDACLVPLKQLLERVPVLRHISLRGNGLGGTASDGAALVDLVQEAALLQSLDVGYTGVSEATAVAALQAVPLSGLVYVNVDAWRLSVTVAMAVLEQLATNTTLVRLSLNGTAAGASRAVRERLARIEKRNTILWYERTGSLLQTSARDDGPSPFFVVDRQLLSSTNSPRRQRDTETSLSAAMSASRAAYLESALPAGYGAYRGNEPTRVAKSAAMAAAAAQHE